MPLTITEALAEIKTITKRLDKKRQSITPFLARQDGLKDPLEKDGGSVKFIAEERQSILDLETRIITLRSGIAKANAETSITIGKTTRTIADWLIWRREVSADQGKFLAFLNAQIAAIRSKAKQAGSMVVPSGTSPEQPADWIINISEPDLIKTKLNSFWFCLWCMCS